MLVGIVRLICKNLFKSMKTTLCCREMEIFLNDPRDPVEYNPVFREYFVRLNNRSNVIILAYCPWCGSKLPASLKKNIG